MRMCPWNIWQLSQPLGLHYSVKPWYQRTGKQLVQISELLIETHPNTCSCKHCILL